MAEDIQLPREMGTKVVQMYVDGRPVLRSEGNMVHSQILRDTLNELEIDFLTVPNWKGIPVPALSGERYRVVGMGHCTQLGENRYIFSGDSLDYEIGIDVKFLDEIRKRFPNVEIRFRK